MSDRPADDVHFLYAENDEDAHRKADLYLARHSDYLASIRSLEPHPQGFTVVRRHVPGTRPSSSSCPS